MEGKKQNDPPSGRWNKQALFKGCEEVRLMRAAHLPCVNNFKSTTFRLCKQGGIVGSNENT